MQAGKQKQKRPGTTILTQSSTQRIRTSPGEAECGQYLQLLQYVLYDAQFLAESSETCKETEKCDLYTWKQTGTETASERTQMWGLVDKYFKATIINMFAEPKWTTSKGLKQGLMTMAYKIQNKRNYKNNQMEILESKSSISQMKTLLQKLNRFELLAENPWIWREIDKDVAIWSTQRKKQMKENEWSLRET